MECIEVGMKCIEVGMHRGGGAITLCIPGANSLPAIGLKTNHKG